MSEQIEATPERQREFDSHLLEEEAWLTDDTPLACGIENPESCESCQ